MPVGAGAGIGIGIGQGLGELGDAITRRRERQANERDKQADAYEQQARDIAANIAKVGGKDSPEAAPLMQQLTDVVTKHNSLYPPHETPALIARIQKFVGKKPSAPTPDPRAGSTVEGVLAATPAQKTDWQVDTSLPMRPSNGIVYRAERNVNTGAVRWQPLPGMTPQDLRPPGSETLSPEDYEEAQRVKAGLEPKATTEKPKKPLTFQYHPQTGGLTSITDPNSGATYTIGNIATAPPEIKTPWDAIQKQQADELKRKDDAAAKKEEEAEARQTRSFQNALDRQAEGFNFALQKKDYEDAKKVVVGADNDYQGALDRMATMDKNLEAGLKGDQQAMLSLVANHIGMTLGAQKGSRINQAVWNEAIQSTPLLARVEAKFDENGYLSGVTLAPEQMRSMVKLAHEKVDILKDHKRRVEDEYHDALNPGKRKTSTSAPTPQEGPEDDPLGILPTKKK